MACHKPVARTSHMKQVMMGLRGHRMSVYPPAITAARLQTVQRLCWAKSERVAYSFRLHLP